MKLVAPLDFNNQTTSNVPNPGTPGAIANKAYVDALAHGMDWKDSVRLATIAALPANTRVGNVLTANANGVIPNIDGVAPAVGNRVLVKNEAGGINNGFYDVTSIGAAGAPWILTRSVDADDNAEVTAGMSAMIEEGSLADSTWALSTNNPIVVNVTALAFVQTSAGTAIAAGAGLVQTGNNYDVNPGAGIQVVGDAVTVDPTVVARKFTALIGNGAATVIAVAHNLNNQNVLVQVFDAGTNSLVFADVVLTDANTVTVTFANAPANNAYRVVVIG